MSSRPLTPSPSQAPDQFRAPTAWGDAIIQCRDGLVVELRPPEMSPADDRASLRDATSRDAPPAIRGLAERLAAYLEGDPVELAAREEVEAWLDAAGVDGFRREISLALFDVPRGVTLSYGELAALTGRPGAARAAGTTCARNPLPIVVPCHRVLHAGARRGDVGAYGAATGSEYKRRLLELEGARIVSPAG